MTAMSPWKPHEIASLTPMQLLCLSHEEPPGPRSARSMDELEAIEADSPRWDGPS